MSLAVDEMALDELAVDEKAVDDWQTPPPQFTDFHTQLECLLDCAEKTCREQNTLAYYENS